VTRRLREPAERPLDPSAGRIVALLGGAVCLGFAVLIGLGLTGPGATGPARPIASSQALSRVAARPAVPVARRAAARGTGSRFSQDPQDRPGSAAARRADRGLAVHRALQHVPWRHGGVSIDLVGAIGSKAVLAVRATVVAEAHRGYRAFLRRFHDDGRAYLPRFRARGDHRGR
jgi:hypothetical protein